MNIKFNLTEQEKKERNHDAAVLVKVLLAIGFVYAVVHLCRIYNFLKIFL